MMIKFIAKPYQYLAYRQIPTYPITMFNCNSAITYI